MLWIEPAKRERKTANYSVDKYYSNQMRPNAVPRPEKIKPPRAPKQLHMCVLPLSLLHLTTRLPG
jgi:hypothetical protein